MEPLEQLYARSSSFGRDFFYYVVSAFLFFFCVASPLLLKITLDFGSTRYYGLDLQLGVSEKIILFLVLLVVSFAIGHLLLCLGVLYRSFWRKRLSEQAHVRNFTAAEEAIRRLIIKAKQIENAVEISPYSHDFHLMAEMMAFCRNPELHERFIERYNMLAFLRLSIASSTLTGGLVCFFLLGVFSYVYVLPAALFWIFIGCIILRQHFITRTGFLNRVYTAVLIANGAEQ